MSLERHERTSKHLREVREIQRLSQLEPAEDPDQAEFWTHYEEVDWQVHPTRSSKIFEEMMETDEDMTWYAYMQQVEQTEDGVKIPVKRMLPPTNELEDPRQYSRLYKEIFEGETENNLEEEIPDILDQMLENDVDPSRLEKMVTELEENLTGEKPTRTVHLTKEEQVQQPEAEERQYDVTEAEVDELERLLQIALEAVTESEAMTNTKEEPEVEEQKKEDGESAEQKRQREREEFVKEFQEFEAQFMEEEFPDQIQWLVLSEEGSTEEIYNIC